MNIGRILFFGLLALTPTMSGSVAQSVLDGVNMSLPKMTEAKTTREEIRAKLEAATLENPADFTRVWMNGLDLSGLDFSGAILRASSMNNVNLQGAILDGAILSQAWMVGADLTDASLVGAELFQTQLGRSNLTNANLKDARAAADFTKANLTGAVFQGADFSADMRNQSMGLMRGVLKSAKGDSVDFTGASMNRADLEFAKLPNAIFTDADLSMTTLGGADLSGSDVSGANFMDADLTSTRIKDLQGTESANLEDAKNLDRALR